MYSYLKASVGMYHVCDYPYYSCLVTFHTAIPTSPINFMQICFTLVAIIVLPILDTTLKFTLRFYLQLVCIYTTFFELPDPLATLLNFQQ